MPSCSACSTVFEMTEEDHRFYETISPTFQSRKFLVPPPTHCPECRQRRRLAAINETFLYPGTCGLCHRSILTQFPPHLKQPIYCHECWHSDHWDPREYGKEVDFSRPFMEQVMDLKKACPAPALDTQGTNVNSDYIHCAGSCKNCYLIMHADFCEDCYYGYGFKNNKFCVDGFYNLHCELCYDCVDVYKCYDLTGSQDCIRCASSAFLRDCVGCRNCFLCVGLRNQEYCFENKQLTKEEYERKMAQIDIRSYRLYEECARRLKALEKQHTFRQWQNTNIENGLGDHLKNCKNAIHCYDCEDGEDLKYCTQVVLGSKNCYDINQYGTNLQQSYECCIAGENSYHLLFCIDGNVDAVDLFYCHYAEASKNCFGCASINHMQYCVLNKQYTQQEYETLVPRVIEHMKSTGEWGEFFPISLSLFGYNKTTAQWYYPESKEGALEKGYTWDDHESPRPQVAKVIPAATLPDRLDEVGADILDVAIECAVSNKLFKIQSAELEFYRKKKVPLPRLHPDQRHFLRFQKRNPRRMWDRPCAKCGTHMKTTFAPDRPEMVYCDACYLKTVY